MAAHDAVAHLEIDDCRTDDDDYAGGFATRNKRGFGAELIFSGEHQHIDVLDAPRADSHLDLT
jgi:hypothetical protein